MQTATIVTLVIAILSAIISIFTAFIPTWLNRLYAKWTAIAKSNADFNAHKEPVLIAAIHLALELYNFLDDEDNYKRFYHSTAYLCYLFAIFFARLEALKNGVQFLNLGKSNADLVRFLCSIELILFEKISGPQEGKQHVVFRRDDIQAMIEVVRLKPNSNGSKNEDKTQGADLMGYATFFSLLEIHKFPFQKEGDTNHEGPSQPTRTTIANTQDVTPFQQEPDTRHEEPGRSTLTMAENIKDTYDDVPSPPDEPAMYFEPQGPRLEKIPSRSNLTTVSKYSGQPNIYQNYSKWFKPLLDACEVVRDDNTGANLPKSADNCYKTGQCQDWRDFRFRKLQHHLIDLIKKLDRDEKRIAVRKGHGTLKPVRPSQDDPKCCRCEHAYVIWKEVNDCEAALPRVSKNTPLSV